MDTQRDSMLHTAFVWRSAPRASALQNSRTPELQMPRGTRAPFHVLGCCVVIHGSFFFPNLHVCILLKLFPAGYAMCVQLGIVFGRHAP